MNRKRVENAIKLMERVRDRGDHVDIMVWQQTRGVEPIPCPARTETALHKCGAAACFGGWLAVSVPFRRAGGKMGWDGSPQFGIYVGYDAVAAYLDISSGLATWICSPDGYKDTNSADAVIKRLESLLT